MRYLVGFVLAVALGASPRSVSAQNGQEGAASEQNQEATRAAVSPSEEVAGTSPELDWSLMEAQGPPVRRARAGLIGSAAVTGVGALLFGITFLSQFQCIEIDFDEPCRPERSWHRPVRVTGGILMVGGAVGMIVSGVLLGVRKRQPRDARHAAQRRTQWDLTRSRLVF